MILMNLIILAFRKKKKKDPAADERWEVGDSVRKDVVGRIPK